MLSKIRAWYLRNYEAITWFIIGWLAFGGLVNLGRGEYVSALVLWIIALANYIFVKKD